MGVYRQRPLLTALVVIFLITTFTYYTGYSIQPADTLEPIERPKVPVTTSDLAVTLHQVHKDPPTIQVIVENKHPYSFITILLWDSPLDFLALPIGLFEIKPEGSDKPISMNKTDIKRKYPPHWDLLLALRPGDRRAQDIVLEPPLVPLGELRERGKTAKVTMKGRWRAVWKGDLDDVTEESLRSIEVNRGGMMGRFESDELEIDLWETEIKEKPAEEDWREGYYPEGPPPEQPPPDEPSPDEPPPEGPPPEEGRLEGELPPEDERPDEERPVEERPPEENEEDHEEIGKVHNEPEHNEKDEKDDKDDKEVKEEGKKEDEKKDKDEKKNKEEEKEKDGSKKGKDEKKDDKKDDLKADKKKPPPEPGRDDEHPDKDSHDDESRKEDDAKRIIG
ncbi:uncharacterized protein J3D65DRAFT_270076 [Phyllosticta citribraziliensis]|uniref:Uncharacterized protein n=1 Tax=Phyllosticta citribraziliensis TaxID=989973 RepID=A0ABR1M117_9PEZI